MRNITTTIRMSATRNEITVVDHERGNETSTVSLAGHPAVDKVVDRETKEVRVFHRWRNPTPAEKHQIARMLCDWHGIKARRSAKRHGIELAKRPPQDDDFEAGFAVAANAALDAYEARA